MAKITLIVEGSTEELKPILQYISEQQLIEVTKQLPKEDEVDLTKELTPYWTEDKVRKVWRDITFDCRDVLKEIARYEDGISWYKLMDNLKLKANQIGGRLSSLGHQLRIHDFIELSHPIIAIGYYYRLDPIWRQTILKIEEELKKVLKDIK